MRAFDNLPMVDIALCTNAADNNIVAVEVGVAVESLDHIARGPRVEGEPWEKKQPAKTTGRGRHRPAPEPMLLGDDVLEGILHLDGQQGGRRAAPLKPPLPGSLGGPTRRGLTKKC